VARGYGKPLYVLPFDHRASFETGMFGWKGALSAEQTAQIADAKRVIYDGFVAAIAGGVPKDAAGILVDEQFGAAITREASSAGHITCAPLEKSGQDEFDFDYGDAFGEHILAFDPVFTKVLVRYNPAGDAGMNERQTARLRMLADWLHEHGRKFLFELLVPAEPAQLESVGGDTNRFDSEVRPGLMIESISALQDAGVEADIWKIEGIDQRADCEHIAQTVRRDGRDHVACVVLGRGADDAAVVHWLQQGAGVPGYIGFAIGRTIWWDALKAYLDGSTDRSEAAKTISENYRRMIDVYRSAS
jgi:myo-inositol catabolism protein IolC